MSLSLYQPPTLCEVQYLSTRVYINNKMNKFSILVYLSILLFSSQTILLVSAKEEGECSSSVLDEDPSCPSRDHIIRCAGEYMDTNKNKKLERSELEAAIDTLPWYGKGMSYIYIINYLFHDLLDMILF